LNLNILKNGRRFDAARVREETLKNWGAVMKRMKSLILSQNPPVLQLSLQFLGLLVLGISPLHTDMASAQQRGRAQQQDRRDDRPRGNRNQNGCFEGDGLHRVPCPFDNDIFYRPGSGDHADGSERWDRGDGGRVAAICVNPADRTPLKGDALKACADGARAARFFAEDVAGPIGEIEGYRYGYSYGLSDGANEATSLRDRLGRLAYADELVSQGSSQYQDADQILRNPPADTIGSALANQLQSARNALSTDMGTKAAEGYSRGISTDGPNAAVDQFEGYTRDHTRPRPNIRVVDDRRNIPVLDLSLDADPFGARVGYTEFCTIVDRLDFDRRQGRQERYGFNPYNQWDRNTVRYSFLDRFYFSDADRRDRYLRPSDLCFSGGRFYPVRKWYNNEDGGIAFNVWLENGRLYGPRDTARQYWNEYKEFERPGDERDGRPQDPGLKNGDRNRRAVPRQGSGAPGTPATPDTPASPSVPETPPAAPQVDQASAFRIGFTNTYRPYYDRFYQISFSRSMEAGYDNGNDMGFAAAAEQLRERGCASAFNDDYIRSVTRSYNDGYTDSDGRETPGYAQGYTLGFKSRWNEYNSNAVLSISVESITGSLGDQTYPDPQHPAYSVFRPGEVLSARLKITNSGGLPANLTIQMSGDDVKGNRSVAVLPSAAIPALTPSIIKSVNGIGTVVNPIGPIQGVKQSNIFLTVTPSVGKDTTASTIQGIQEWVAPAAGRGIACTTDFDARTGTVTVTVQNNSIRYVTPRNVGIALSLDDVQVGETAEVGAIEKSSTKSASFRLADLVPFKLLEGTHRLDVTLTHGESDVAARVSRPIQVDREEKAWRVPDLFNRIMMDYGRKVDGVYNSFGYQPKVAAFELGADLDADLVRRAEGVINSLIEDEIEAGRAGLPASSLNLLIDLYNGNPISNPAWQRLTTRDFAYIYNTFAPGFDKAAHAFSLRNPSALNRVATASYLIEYNNLARGWYDAADRTGRPEKNRVKDLVKKAFGLVGDRPKGPNAPRMTVWDDQDIQDVPGGSNPKKKDIRLYWMDGLHPNRVSSTEDPDVFRDYWNGRHGDSHWRLRPDQTRQVSDW
jgi:hypothetical protein